LSIIVIGKEILNLVWSFLVFRFWLRTYQFLQIFPTYTSGIWFAFSDYLVFPAFSLYFQLYRLFFSSFIRVRERSAMR